MRKIVCACVGVLCNIALMFAQNQMAVENDIRNTLEEFESAISQINDPNEPLDCGTIGALFEADNYFTCNGMDTISLERALRVYSYSVRYLGRKHVVHQFKIKDISKRNPNSKSDNRWTVKAVLKRTYSSAQFKEVEIEDSPTELVFISKGDGERARLVKFDFNFVPKINKPTTKTDIQFSLNRGVIYMPAKGGSWACGVTSQSKTTKVYPNGREETVSVKPVDFSVASELLVEKSPSYVSGVLGKNNSAESRTYKLHFFSNGVFMENSSVSLGRTSDGGISILDKNGQVNTTLQKKYCKNLIIYQKGNPVAVRDERTFEINAHYGGLYGVGLSFMGKPEGSRLAAGFIVATDFDCYRGVQPPTEGYSINIGGSSETTTPSFYKVSEETVKPKRSNYSALMDPYNEAKEYTKHWMLMAQGGVFITNWMRLDLGMGIAVQRDLHFMKTAYSYTRYSFEKLDPSQPDVDDIYGYRACYKNYYYKDHGIINFAARPALSFRVPAGNDTSICKYLTMGIGYTIVPNAMKASSLDLSIGVNWEVF